jgi:hypothetical protein
MKIALVCLLAAGFGLACGCETTVITNPRPPAHAVVHEFIYYPAYEIYYCTRTKQYVYYWQGAWVWRPNPPPTLRVELLRDAVSVKMDFRDDPAIHHARIVKLYPRSWTPPPGWSRGRKEGWRR